MTSESTGYRPPGTAPKRRLRIHYELLGCAVHGHELVGADAARIRDGDSLVVRDAGAGLRWHRCLRCDAWLPLPAPEHPMRDHPPDRDEIELPLRGKPLRDRYVLRLIALDRLVHFVLLAILAIAIFLFLGNRTQLREEFYRIVTAWQGGFGGPSGQSSHGILHELEHAFDLKTRTLWTLGLVVAAYAVLEGVEAIGLWRQKRWAEYLTFIATTLLMIPEIYELTGRISATKIIALVVNVLVVVYLLYAKRLFGIRGGGRAEQAERRHDLGWQALERAMPPGWPNKPPVSPPASH
jgi:uncharacterized membrane protein (DUF2068 family)